MINCLQMIFHSPRIKNAITAREQRNLFIKQINGTQFPVKFGLLTASLIFVLFGNRSANIPGFKRIAIPFQALVDMYSIPQSENTVDQNNSQNNHPCNFNSTTENIYDEIVVGSGPGGAVAANVSTQSGNHVLMIEVGDVADKKIKHHSAEQLVYNFAFSGLEVILGKKLLPFAQGKALGGGSQVNSGLYHRAPSLVADQWRSIVGISKIEWDQCENWIENTIHVQTQNNDSLGLYRESPILRLAKDLQWECKVVPRWRNYYKDGYVHYGMNETVLKPAIKQGLTVLTNHRVKKLSLNNGIIHVKTFGNKCSHDLRARHVTISAGTIETPKILIRSGFARPKDIKINFHAMTRLIGTFQNTINDLHDIDPHQTWSPDYSVKIGAAVSTRQLLAATKTNMGVTSDADPGKTGVYYVSTIPRGLGRFLNVLGIIMPYYNFSKESIQEISNNTKILGESLRRIGAIEVLGSITKPSISTVHIFGSLPIGSSAILDKFGFVEGTSKAIRVCDGSILPSAPAVNPQGPISVLCLYLSRKIHETDWAN